MDIKKSVLAKARMAREAARALSTTPSRERNEFVGRAAATLVTAKEEILRENQKDVQSAEQQGLARAFIDRLTLNEKRIEEMATTLREIAGMPDPVNRIIAGWRRPNGLMIEKVTVPIGVIGLVYESRPNVTTDAAGLCIKSANAVILRGGSEALNSNLKICGLLQQVASACHLPKGCVQMIETTDRKAVEELLKLDKYVDVVVPRGGKSLISAVTKMASMPVIKHYEGVCHTYVDSEVDLDLAYRVCFNAKVQRPGTCNAMETLLVHKNVASSFLPKMAKLLEDAGVEIRGCSATRRMIPSALGAKETDWATEYLDLTLSVKIVQSLTDAIEHIQKYGSGHSEAILTKSYDAARRFTQAVDASAVFMNTSTRFNDGYQFGLGAELGISTDKLHVRGPMGLEALVTYKYVVYGDGQVRE
ncbi:glutamate-5-semialdehyde dehydrogenase [Candidatus Aerophobetes bacterium]|uniref:Gamma-glutamyl phosphate reductase n=1 Tax=Aerophobetes bacterium TaxID=2030807 RepID=A0A523WBS0_UNCAE|nr:MAG: glutamate-5-semialdehyde dehydrogenase [Candidatus Aerophobetes bacterium]